MTAPNPESPQPPADSAPAAQTPPQTSPGDGTSSPSSGEHQTEPDTFPRDYVERLREEAAGHRTKAKAADALAARLTTAYAAATGRLADATDLPYDDALLDDDGIVDPVKVDAAVDALLIAKPHLASRRPQGPVDQGARDSADTFSLAGMLRAGAGS